MMSEITAGELRNLTRAEIIFHTHAATACKGVRPTMRNRTPAKSVRIRNASVARAIRMKSADGAEMIREEERRCCRSEKGHFARVRHMSAAVDRYEHESFSLKDYRVLSLIKRSETNWVRARMVERAKQHYIP